MTDYLDGSVSDLEALRAACLNLGEVESDLEPLEAERKVLRAQIERIVSRLPQQRAEVAGFGALQMTSGGDTVTWEGKALDALIAELVASGDVELMSIAGRIAQARKIGTRAGSLRITRPRP